MIRFQRGDVAVCTSPDVDFLLGERFSATPGTKVVVAFDWGETFHDKDGRMWWKRCFAPSADRSLAQPGELPL